MTTPAQAASLQHEDIINGLRARYEMEGYAFTVGPDKSNLPAFVGSYRPDALAQKQGHNIAIEVRERRSHAQRTDLQAIRRLFDGHLDWQLNVVFTAGAPPAIKVPVASPGAIRKRLAEVRSLIVQGQRRAAIVMVWSLLEATVQSIEGDASRRPLAPGTIVQALAINGLLDVGIEPRLRALVDLRNRIVHGDVDAEPTIEDVELMIAVAEGALETEAV